jgi:hypothetical protein
MAEPTLDLASFEHSLEQDRPPMQANMALRALWYDAKGVVESAIRAADSDQGLATLRVRAYLYRKAGEHSKTRVAYWKAGAAPWEGSTESEWRDIVQSILVEFPVASAYGA